MRESEYDTGENIYELYTLIRSLKADIDTAKKWRLLHSEKVVVAVIVLVSDMH